MKHYILKNKQVVEATMKEAMKWGEGFDNKRVASTYIKTVHMHKPDNIDVHISTVFLGIDHSFDGSTPILFETMVFGGKHNEYCERYCTWGQAERGHKKIIKKVKNDNF